MKISRLRLLGFKSFVEPTDLVIEPGLTGVVGPNGCGKSNLLEALRWVMGETSHKSMRAAAMDDVIFSGTSGRPARNFAEVTMFLDNAERRAPAEFNDNDVIEITRRIEREAGSAYRINGRESRARDIKILFEDAATGARSPALVRQGQIAEIVNAKPEQRRRVLEDAAGVAGLHSRRHEAELRLKAAEQNLARLSDILGQLNSQIESLKRQARQARRYKETSAEIRRYEALVAYLSWTEAQGLVVAEEASLTSLLGALGLATEAEAAALVEDTEAAEAMQPLREAEAAKGAALGRLRIEGESLDREAQRIAERQRELNRFADGLAADMRREQALVGEATETLARIAEEQVRLAEAERVAADERATADARLAATEAELDGTEGQLSEVTGEVATARAQRQALESALRANREAVQRFEGELLRLAGEAREVAARAPDAQRLTAITDDGQRLAHEIADIEARLIAVEERSLDLMDVSKASGEAAAAAQLAASALSAECATLLKLVAPVRDGGLPPIEEGLRVTPGYEAAVVAALGDDLEAPAADDAPVHWRLVEAGAEDPALPADVEPLSLRVEGAPELVRTLSQIGVVAPEMGGRLQARLKPGQRLVSLAGDLWRWDGFVAHAGGGTPAAQRLAERNRLAGVLQRERDARASAKALAAEAALAASRQAEAEGETRELRRVARERQAEMARAREALTKIERAARETESRLANIAGARARAEEELGHAQARAEETERSLAAARPVAELEPLLHEVQAKAAAARTAASEARARVRALEHAEDVRRDRLATLASERQRWTNRSEAAGLQIATLNERQERAAAEIAVVEEQPALIADKRERLMTALASAEAERRTAADQLAVADQRQRMAVQALRAAQARASEAREAKARSEAKLEGARARRQDEARKIRETLEVAPEECLTLAQVTPGTSLPPLGDVDRQLGRMKADRERLGGVNLTADDELSAMLEQVSSMDAERADVEQAVAKLRGAIGQLNREGKKRLDEAFATVNGHFQRLFTTLFGGGEARLEMVEGEDPLESGLEIIAKPPGKKPATLSLLSGGEQTLTALSLIFAVFLTNPSPICVLDEVDAPLDDANVDRFCTLMEKMAEETATRFLVITHHPMTMTRMNRLFGVTMAEKGVSQLVSVDLETAQRFREAG